MPTGQRWKIATIAGIPVYLSSMWVLFAIFITLSQYSLFSNSFLVSDQTGVFLLTLASAGLFFGSILLHEGAHAVVARSLGLPVRGITLTGWGGYTETPSNARGPLGEFLVSAAGPATNLILGIAFFTFERTAATSHPLAAIVVGYYAGLNLLVAGLNALPGFPLDGGRALMAGIWKATGDRTQAMRLASFAGFAVAGAIALYGLNRLQTADQQMGIWALIIAFLIFSGARQALARVPARMQLREGTAADAMRPASDGLPAGMPLSEALDRFFRGADAAAFPVVDAGGTYVGSVSLASAKKVGSRDPLRPVREALQPKGTVPVIDPSTRLDDVIDLLGGREGVVVRDGRLAGRLSPMDVERWFERRNGGPTAWTNAAPGGPPGDDDVPPRPDGR
jgi:Zn-dependent protease/CBS domain-containing protein